MKSHPLSGIVPFLSRGIPSVSRLSFGVFRILLAITIALLFHQLSYALFISRGSQLCASLIYVRWLLVIAFALGLFPRTSWALLTVVCIAQIVTDGKAHYWNALSMAMIFLTLAPWHCSGLRIHGKAPENCPPASRSYGFAQWSVGLSVGVFFASAALAKLTKDPIAWIKGGMLNAVIEDLAIAPGYMHGIGLWLLNHPAFLSGLAIGGLLIELLWGVVPFVRRQWLKILFILFCGVPLLLGFYLLQGHFWPTWWACMLLFAIPFPRASVPEEPIPTELGMLRMAVVMAFIVAQLGAVAARYDGSYFISNLPMYSGSIKPNQTSMMKLIKGRRRIERDPVTILVDGARVIAPLDMRVIKQGVRKDATPEAFAQAMRVIRRLRGDKDVYRIEFYEIGLNEKQSQFEWVIRDAFDAHVETKLQKVRD